MSGSRRHGGWREGAHPLLAGMRGQVCLGEGEGNLPDGTADHHGDDKGSDDAPECDAELEQEVTIDSLLIDVLQDGGRPWQKPALCDLGRHKPHEEKSGDGQNRDPGAACAPRALTGLRTC